MPYSVEDIKGAVSEGKGFARGNLFKVKLPSIDPRASIKNLNLLCKSVQLPARQLNVTARQIGLPSINIVNGFSSQDITMTFRMLNNPYVKDYFDTWQSLIVDHNNYEVGYYRDYAKNITISVLKKSFGFSFLNQQIFEVKSSIPSNLLSRLPSIGPLNLATGELDFNKLTEDAAVYECTLIDAYPTSITAIELSDDAVDSILELTVSFTYKDWTSKSSAPDDRDSLLGIAAGVLNKFGLGN